LAAVNLGPDFSAVPPATLEAAARRGTAVHALIEAHSYGYLDQAEVTPEIAPHFNAYLKFLAESKHEAIVTEFRVEHPAWRYQGHIDRVGWLLGLRWILDFKTGEAVDLPAAGRQLAGYRMAWNAMRPTEPVEAVAVLQLKGDGTYRLHDEIVNEARHEEAFLAACVVWRERAA